MGAGGVGAGLQQAGGQLPLSLQVSLQVSFSLVGTGQISLFLLGKLLMRNRITPLKGKALLPGTKICPLLGS